MKTSPPTTRPTKFANSRVNSLYLHVRARSARKRGFATVCAVVFFVLVVLQTAAPQPVPQSEINSAVRNLVEGGNHGTYGLISEWNTSKITSLSSTFKQRTSMNFSLLNWDTSRVTTMQQTFQQAYAFDQPLSEWDTSRVTSLFYTFSQATNFNQPLSEWDTSRVAT